MIWITAEADQRPGCDWSGFFFGGLLAGAPAHRFQLHGGRPFHKLAVRIETRAVAWAIPGAFIVVPAQHTSHMGADGTVGSQVPPGISVDRDVGAAIPDDTAFAFGQTIHITGRGLQESVGNEVTGHLDVLADKVTGTGEPHTARVVEIFIGVMPLLDQVADHGT